jgi:hypothetical protein
MRLYHQLSQASQAASAIINLPDNPSINSVRSVENLIDQAVDGTNGIFANMEIHIANKYIVTSAVITGGGSFLASWEQPLLRQWMLLRI